jgi:uncharacterized phosphosugar-binding protein
MTTPVAYLNAVRRVLDHLEQTQLPAVEKAADLVIEALTHGGVVYCSEVGHGIQGDFVDRAGGLIAVKKFSFSFSIQDKVPECLKDRAQPEPIDKELETIRFAVRTSNLRAGDVILMGSVSGRNRAPIELALACRAKGVKVIGLTSMAYTAKAESLHPSGKKLFEVVDVAIDNGAPYGDAAVDIPGYDIRLLPVSGIAMDASGWLIWGRVMEKMAAAGKPPTVFMSVNREGGWDHYHKSQALYEKQGY